MLTIFQEVLKEEKELEDLRVLAQANQITYPQRGTLHTAERFKILESTLGSAVDYIKSLTDN